MKKISTKIIVITMVITILSAVSVGGIFAYNIAKLADDNLNTISKVLNDDYDVMIKSEVETAISMLGQVYARYQSGELTLEEAEKLGADTLRGMTYGESGYFWADTTEGVSVVLLGNDTEGTNRVNYQDENGKYIVKEFISNAKNGGGYIDYYFPKPGEEKASLKRGYTQLFEPFQWEVGTGT